MTGTWSLPERFKTAETLREQRARLRTQAWLSAWFLAFIGLWLVDGALRKWAFPAASDQLYFARDAVTLLTFVAVLVAGIPRSKTQVFVPALAGVLFLTCVACAQLFLTVLPPASLVVGLLTYSVPVMAIAMVLALDDRARQLRRLQVMVLAILPVEAVLTVVQTLSPATSTWNRTGDNGTALVTSEAVVRATGTFVSPAAMTVYVILATAIVLFRLLSGGRRVNIVDLALAASCVTTITLGGSRGAVLGSLIVLAGALAWSLGGQSSNLRRIARVGGAIGVAYLFIRIADRLFPSVTSAFARRFDEASTNESSSDRIVDSGMGHWDLVPDMSWLGDGMGSHTLSGIAAGSPLNWYEIELERWVSELGALGLALCVLRQVGAVVLVLAALRNARSSGSPLTLLASLALAPSLLYGAVIAPSSLAGGAIAAIGFIWFGWSAAAPQTADSRASS